MRQIIADQVAINNSTTINPNIELTSPCSSECLSVKSIATKPYEPELSSQGKDGLTTTCILVWNTFVEIIIQAIVDPLFSYYKWPNNCVGHLFNRPFYQYGGHIELIRFKEYYTVRVYNTPRMPKGDEHISFVFSSAFQDIFSQSFLRIRL